MACSLEKFLSSKCRHNPSLIKKFVRFLYRHGIYGKYIFYYVSTSEYWRQEYQREDGIPSQFISSAFRWNKTPEGHDYWENIHIMWCAELNQKVNKIKCTITA